MEIVYIQFKQNMEINTPQTLKLQDVAAVSTDNKNVSRTPIYTITKKDASHIVIDSFIVLSHVQKMFPMYLFQILGPSQCSIQVNKKQPTNKGLWAIIVWILLFIGTAMTIMNFHYDVSMQEVQQKLHFLLTGKENDYPLFIQIPYSFGLGIGMLLFFNYWFRKKITDEPSPLEIELFNYQKQIRAYLLENEGAQEKYKEHE